ncbi:unnamed protein product, partial [Ixodes pacificus]
MNTADWTWPASQTRRLEMGRSTNVCVQRSSKIFLYPLALSLHNLTNRGRGVPGGGAG